MSVYLDHASGTPIRQSAAAQYVAALGLTGNPSSVHRHGQAARRLLEESRERLAAVLDCDAPEIVFTSGGTESVGTAIKGAYWAAPAGRRSILVPGGEHHATIDTVDWLVAHEGASAVALPVDAEARLSTDALGTALARHADDAALVTLLWANNEVGSINPVAELSALARRSAVPVHVDAVAAFGVVPVSFRQSGADLLSVSGHKIGAPVGIGALVVGRATRIEALLHGGGQERRLRSGTPAAAAAAAFAVAAEEAARELEPEGVRVSALRDRALGGLLAALPTAVVRGADPANPHARLPGNLHLTVEGAEGDALLFVLDEAGISVSTGSACQAGVTELSHVLLAMGLPAEVARGALRITFGHTSTGADVDALLAAAPRLAALVRAPARAS